MNLLWAIAGLAWAGGWQVLSALDGSAPVALSESADATQALVASEDGALWSCGLSGGCVRILAPLVSAASQEAAFVREDWAVDLAKRRELDFEPLFEDEAEFFEEDDDRLGPPTLDQVEVAVEAERTPQAPCASGGPAILRGAQGWWVVRDDGLWQVQQGLATQVSSEVVRAVAGEDWWAVGHRIVRREAGLSVELPEEIEALACEDSACDGVWAATRAGAWHIDASGRATPAGFEGRVVCGVARVQTQVVWLVEGRLYGGAPAEGWRVLGADLSEIQRFEPASEGLRVVGTRGRLQLGRDLNTWEPVEVWPDAVVLGEQMRFVATREGVWGGSASSFGEPSQLPLLNPRIMALFRPASCPRAMCRDALPVVTLTGRWRESVQWTESLPHPGQQWEVLLSLSWKPQIAPQVERRISMLQSTLDGQVELGSLELVREGVAFVAHHLERTQLLLQARAQLSRPYSEIRAELARRLEVERVDAQLALNRWLEE